MGVDEGNLQVVVIDVDVMTGKWSNNYFSTVHIFTSSDYGVYNSHYILHYL